MRLLASIVATLSLALWLGGCIALFLFVQTLFTEDRSIAIQAAPRMFLVFAKYQLLVAAVALISTVAWRIATGSRWVAAIFVLLAFATLAAAMNGAIITPKMEAIRLAGESGSDEFKKYHGISMIIYVAQTGVLLVATILLPSAISKRSTQLTTAVRTTTN